MSKSDRAPIWLVGSYPLPCLPVLTQDLDLARQKFGGIVLGQVDDKIAAYGMDPSKEASL